MAAVDAVLAIPELLEHILLCLPPRNVIRSRRVCKMWNAVVDSSIHVRRLCCRSPAGDVRRIDRHRTARKSSLCVVAWVESAHCAFVPLFRLPGIGAWEYLQYSVGDLLRPSSQAEYFGLYWPETLDEILAIPTSTHDLFICQPPVEAVDLRMDNSLYSIRATLRLRSGLKVGHVRQTIITIMSQTPGAFNGG